MSSPSRPPTSSGSDHTNYAKEPNQAIDTHLRIEYLRPQLAENQRTPYRKKVCAVLSAEVPGFGQQATDVTSLGQLVLEVYLAAWTRADGKDEQTSLLVEVGDSCLYRSAPARRSRDRSRRLGRRRESQYRQRGRTALSACARREYVGSGCYTTDPYLAGQTTNCWNGG